MIREREQLIPKEVNPELSMEKIREAMKGARFLYPETEKGKISPKELIKRITTSLTFMKAEKKAVGEVKESLEFTKEIF